MDWLRGEAEKIREPLFTRISAAIRKFNSATWPCDLGLEDKFYQLWRNPTEHTAKAEHRTQSEAKKRWRTSDVLQGDMPV